MARTTSSDVELIIEVDDGDSLTSFIEAANNMVTAVCSSDTDYDADQLELIERWLTAHFYAIYKPRAASEKAGPVSENKQYKVDLGLNVTTYGQMAMRLDYNGHLASLDYKMKQGGHSVSVTWLGKDLNTESED